MHVVEALQGVVAQRLEHPVAGRGVVVLLGHDHGPGDQTRDRIQDIRSLDAEKNDWRRVRPAAIELSWM